eukprot:1623090-Lingulodinium_polyedra.AAC.1
MPIARELRSVADRSSLGGMRSPLCAVERLPLGWPTGARVGEATRAFLAARPDLVADIMRHLHEGNRWDAVDDPR